MIANCESSYSRLLDAPSSIHKGGLDAKPYNSVVKMEEVMQMTSNSTVSASDLNDVIQQQLQPLLESVNLNSTDLQQLAAQIKQQQSLGHHSVVVGGGHSSAGNSNGSSSSASPLLKTSESSLSPAPLSSSQQQISGSYSSSSSTNWSQQLHQHHQSSSSSSSSSTSGQQSNSSGENMSNAAAAAWTNALYAAVSAATQQQQISPTLLSQLQQQSNPGYSGLAQKNAASSSNQLKLVNSAQPKQASQTALASLLKANQQPAAEQSSGLLHNLHTIYAPTQQATQVATKPSSSSAAAAALAALADANCKQQQQQQPNGSQHRPLLGNQVHQSRSNFINENSVSNSEDQERSDLNNQMEMYMFNSHLMELIKNYPAQLEQFLKLRNMMQPEESSGANGNNMSEEFQQQIDQIVPANLAAAIASASANGRLNLAANNHANFNRNSPKPAQNFQRHQSHQNLVVNGNSNGNGMMNNHHLPAANGQKQSPPFQQPFAQSFLNNKSIQQNHFGQFQDSQDERFSRKVFVGGLPPDIDEDEIVTHFRRYGNLIVDWPHKAESKSYFPPKGYAFLIFQEERNVQDLIETCVMEDGKLYTVVSSPSMKDKPVQIRPWCLADSDFVMDGSQPLDPQKTIFVGGVPRPIKAIELAMIMDRLYGGVCYAGIDTDPKLKYPKGAGRVAFSNQQSYIAAISARFVQLHHGEIDKRVEVKPYVLDDQMCDECQGTMCAGKFAPFFCANITCLQYYCEQCWATVHSRPGREYHKPLVKEGADRPRRMPFSKS